MQKKQLPLSTAQIMKLFFASPNFSLFLNRSTKN
jgi:hypothetical protein